MLFNPIAAVIILQVPNTDSAKPFCLHIVDSGNMSNQYGRHSHTMALSHRSLPALNIDSYEDHITDRNPDESKQDTAHMLERSNKFKQQDQNSILVQMIHDLPDSEELLADIAKCKQRLQMLQGFEDYEDLDVTKGTSSSSHIQLDTNMEIDTSDSLADPLERIKDPGTFQENLLNHIHEPDSLIAILWFHECKDLVYVFSQRKEDLETEVYFTLMTNPNVFRFFKPTGTNVAEEPPGQARQIEQDIENIFDFETESSNTSSGQLAPFSGEAPYYTLVKPNGERFAP